MKTYKYLWDYDKEELEKTEEGRIFILERMINYGPGDEKIKLADVKKYWNDLNLFKHRKMFFEDLIWGTVKSSLENRSSFYPS